MLTLPVTIARRYALETLLARGGMAEVYRARDLQTDRMRAVKVLQGPAARRRSVRERFEAEAEALRAIDHPNVIRAFDVGEELALAFMVMELAEGGSLGDWVARHGPMPAALAVPAMLEVCEGVGAAHAHGIIHRDIKPENVLLDGNGQCKLADFGIARFLHDADSRFTRTGTVMGTFAFMPPEQRRHASSVDVRADVYALGATLHALLTDRTEADLFTWDREPKLLAGVPEVLLPAVKAALAFVPADRPASAAAFADRLSGLPLGPVPKGTPRLGGRAIVRRVTQVPTLSRPRCVLVTEDDATMRRLLALVLGNAGYTVLLAEDGPSAMRKCDEHTGYIDLLIMDLVLPGEPGTHVAAALGRSRPGVPLLYMTGHSDERLARQGIDLGGKPLLRKPFTPEEVLRTAERAIVGAERTTE